MPARTLSVSLLVLLFCSFAVQAEPTVETVLEGLNNPVAVVLQPETGVLFVSESGAGQVVRVIDGKSEVVISGFPIDQYGEGPKFAIGPLGLAFIGKNILAVGGGGLADGEELLRIYNVPAEGSIEASEMAASFTLGPVGDVAGEGNFYGLAIVAGSLFVTGNGDDTKGWIAHAPVKGTTVGPLQRGIATKEAVGLDAPVALAVAPDGSLVVGQMGEVKTPGDSALSFYDPRSGKLLANFKTGLHDISGLAYGPDGMLYATDFSWLDAGQGSLSRLVAVRGETLNVKARKLLSLERPTAITFAPDGEAYVTVIGPGAAAGEKATGKLLKIRLEP
jgi:hypothetical protein